MRDLAISPQPSTLTPTPTEQIDAFCDQVWLQDGLAPSSLASYRRDLTQWAAWLGRRLTPHPFATLITPLRLKHRCGNGLPAHYISCTAPAYRPTAICRDRAQDRGWPVSLLATGHDAMVSDAQATAAMLDALGREP